MLCFLSVARKKAGAHKTTGVDSSHFLRANLCFLEGIDVVAQEISVSEVWHHDFNCEEMLAALHNILE